MATTTEPTPWPWTPRPTRLSWRESTTLGPDEFAIVRLQPDAGAAPPTLPTLSISDSTRKEGTGGLSVATFTVTLSATPTVPVTVAFTTASGTATEGVDFTGGTEGVTFLPGETDLTYGFAVRLASDGTDELNETFVINLHGASGAQSPMARAWGPSTTMT